MKNSTYLIHQYRDERGDWQVFPRVIRTVKNSSFTNAVDHAFLLAATSGHQTFVSEPGTVTFDHLCKVYPNGDSDGAITDEQLAEQRSWRL